MTLTGRCDYCERREVPCPAPRPGGSTPRGYAELVQLGDHWMHASEVDRWRRPSYGEALCAYEAAIAEAATADQVVAARRRHLAAWRWSLAQTEDGRRHACAAPVAGCRCPVCLDAELTREVLRVRSADVRRGDVICGRAAAPAWTSRAMVLSARWYPTHLSLDLQWLDTGQVMTGCALGKDEEFVVERCELDPVDPVVELPGR